MVKNNTRNTLGIIVFRILWEQVCKKNNQVHNFEKIFATIQICFPNTF